MNAQHKRPALLLILDGWGYREESEHNAIHTADTPVWDRLWQTEPHTLVRTSGLAVGLPEGQMGNSEVGHMNLGAGRVVYQSLTRIDKAIKDNEFFSNPVLCQAIDKAVTGNGAIHYSGCSLPAAFTVTKTRFSQRLLWLTGAVPGGSICTLSWTAATHHHAVPWLHCAERRPNYRAKVTAASHRWQAGSTPWTVTSAGTGFSLCMTCSPWAGQRSGTGRRKPPLKRLTSGTRTMNSSSRRWSPRQGRSRPLSLTETVSSS